MIDIDIDEIVRAMLDNTGDLTYYISKETGEVVHIDETIAQEVEEEYEEADTAIEEWSVDHEDDDTYHEIIYSPTDELDEKELIKQIRYTNQEDYEPVPVITITEFKKIVFEFLEELEDLDENIKTTLESNLSNITQKVEMETIMLKLIGEKEKWDKYFEDHLKKIIKTWLAGIGF